VDPEDVDAIASGIRRILDDASLRERMIAAGRERSRSFTWERCARDTLAVLERVGAQRAPGVTPSRQAVAVEAPPR